MYLFTKCDLKMYKFVMNKFRAFENFLFNDKIVLQIISNLNKN